MEKVLPAGYISIFGNYIWDLFVDKDFRGRGIATNLIKEAMKRIINMGEKLIFATVYKENTISLNLCKSLGFTIDAQVDNKNHLTCQINK